MNHIKELLKTFKPSDKIQLHFNSKTFASEITDQDKKHCRIIAILQLARTEPETLDYILNHSFRESFKYDKEKSELTYEIRFIKERRTKYRGDC